MNIKFLVNDYLIAWNILFTKSITVNLRNLKKKLWNTYRNEYNEIFYEKNEILADYKNFIPNNDTVYNAIIEKEDFNSLLKDAEKTRINVIKIWNKKIKYINHLIKEVIRKNLRDYECFIVNKEFDIKELLFSSDNMGKYVIGKSYYSENAFLIDFMYEIIKEEIEIKENDSLGIKDAILEMAVLGEFATQIDNTSHYKDGTSTLYYLKKQIYPYWLMFLGIPRDDMVKYMTRDNIFFDQNAFAYEKELIKMNIEEFIDFVIRNKRYIIRTKKEIDEIEEII